MIYCDNLNTVMIVANSFLYSKYKHVELDIYFARNYVMKNRVQVVHIPTVQQIAYIFTKNPFHHVPCS
ncbi:hypothetical protein AHAS_Ahas06G0200200 [Arachis hypogaea]